MQNRAGELACEGPRRVLDERMVLVGADREAFLDALMNPGEPPQALLDAFRRLRDIEG